MDSELTPVNEEQLRANRFDLVSRLADDLAHEIRNPLNSIVINLEVLKVRVGRGDRDAALERVGVIETEARRLHVMIDRLLQLLRPDRDESDGFALDHVLDDLLPLVEVRARLAGNTFTTEGDAALIVLMRRDAFKFTLLNLLTAVHDRLGDNGGTLSLACAPDHTASRIRVTIAGEPTARPLAPADTRYERAMAVTAALLEPFRGTLEVNANGVTVFLPRAGGS